MSIDTTTPIPAAPTPAESAPTESAPRTRWAAIVWGAFLAALSAIGLWLLTDRDRSEGVADWALGMTPGTITATVLLCVGTLVLVGGAAGLIRHAQRRTSR
ncbi:hypothetical protein [Microbacterium aurantiacum]|uniref:hypothetical protein n=1 Tax=Microbacterium aurantiacum TaxID=162393 RepID=UPI000C8003A8|nr:hypothetical protein [Microbacterium aurantiacum]